MSTPGSVDVGTIIERTALRPFHIALLLNTCLVMFIEGYDMQVASFAAPSILKTWHLTSAYFGPVFGFGLLGNLIGGTVLGHLGDRFGRKPVLVGGSLVFGVFTLAAAWATTVVTLVVLRFLAGVGIGASIPAAIALGVEYAPASLKARVTSFLFVGYTMGGMVGGLIAARLIPKFGWPSVFQVGGVLPIVIAVVIAATLPESIRFLALRQKRPDQIRAVLLKLSPEMAISRHVVFTVQEVKSPGLPVRQLFTHGRAVATTFLWIAFVSSLLGHYFLTSWLPTILTRTAAPAGYALIAGGLLQGGGGVGGVFLCWLSDKRNMLYIALAYCIACPLIMLMPHGHGASVLLLAFGVGFFLVGGQIGLNAIAGTIYPTDMRATGMGWALGVGRIGSIAGPVLGGFLLSSHISISSLFICTGAIAPICAVAIYLVYRSTGKISSSVLPPNPIHAAEAVS